MFKIGDFSKLSRITVKALRYYDTLGILKPDTIDEENGYRYYETDQLFRASEIVQYKEMGLSLDEISSIILDNQSPSDILRLLSRKKTEITDVIAADKRKLDLLSRYLNELKEEKFMKNVTIKTLPEVIVASFRTIIRNYDELFQVAPAMGEKMKKHGAECRVPAYCFNVYHDKEYKETDIDVEICEAVTKKHADADGLVYKKIGEVKNAVCFYHKGPYETLGKSYAVVFKWIEDNGYVIAGNPRESFIDGCWNKENPEEWLTEIQVPVTK